MYDTPSFLTCRRLAAVWRYEAADWAYTMLGASVHNRIDDGKMLFPVWTPAPSIGEMLDEIQRRAWYVTLENETNAEYGDWRVRIAPTEDDSALGLAWNADPAEALALCLIEALEVTRA